MKKYRLDPKRPLTITEQVEEHFRYRSRNRSRSHHTSSREVFQLNFLEQRKFLKTTAA